MKDKLQIDQRFCNHYGLSFEESVTLAILVQEKEKAPHINVRGIIWYRIAEDELSNTFFKDAKEYSFEDCVLNLWVKLMIETIHHDKGRYITFSPITSSWLTDKPYPKSFTQEYFDNYYLKPSILFWGTLCQDFPDMTTIYILRCDITGMYKIGRTNDITTRLKTLKTANPGIRLIDSYPGVDKTIEGLMHKHFRHKNVAREWFMLNNEDLQSIPIVIKNIQDELCELAYKPQIDKLLNKK